VSFTAPCAIGLAGYFGRLGLERVARDVTPTLQSYLQAKAQP
jgi:hypothetical protein